MKEQFGHDDPASSLFMSGKRAQMKKKKKRNKLLQSLPSVAGESGGGQQAAAISLLLDRGVLSRGRRMWCWVWGVVSLMPSAWDNGKKTVRAARERGAVCLPQIVARVSGWSAGVKTRGYVSVKASRIKLLRVRRQTTGLLLQGGVGGCTICC